MGLKFVIQYQYKQWEDRDDEESNRWWMDYMKPYKSKAARTKKLNELKKSYQNINFKNKEDVMSKKEIVVYTDGSSYYKDKFGGIGIYIKFGEHKKYISRGYSNTTNNRMELRAVIEALKEITVKSIPVHIYSDSEYVINSATGWMFKWEEENFEDRKNADLFRELILEYRKFPKGKLNFKWCKGHNGIEGNEIADMLAGDARKSGEYIKCE